MMRFLGQLLRAVFNRPLDGDLSWECAYGRYQYHGGPRASCDMGCWEEPRCMTDSPRDGWPSERRLSGRIRWVVCGEGE